MLRQVQLCAPKLLGDPCAGLTHRAFLDVERAQQITEHVAIRQNLRVKISEERLQRRFAMLVREMLHQLERAGRTGEMVIQVRAEFVAVESVGCGHATESRASRREV